MNESGKNFIALYVYVDDIIVVGNNENIIDELKR